MPTKPLKIFVMSPVDPQEPPFHHVGVPMTVVVAAGDEDEARRVVAGRFPGSADAWLDSKMSACAELAPDIVGVIAAE